MGKQWKQWLTLFFWAPKSLRMVIAAMKLKDAYSLDRMLWPSYDLDSIFKSRDITLPTKVYLVKVMVFPVVMYRCESWTIKKGEHQRNDAFELWCWRRLFRVLWKARRSNQSTLNEINPEYSLEGLMLKLKPQYFGHLMWRVPTPQFKSINSSALSFLYDPAPTSIHNYWKNHSFDYMDLCWQSDVSDF